MRGDVRQPPQPRHGPWDDHPMGTLKSRPQVGHQQGGSAVGVAPPRGAEIARDVRRQSRTDSIYLNLDIHCTSSELSILSWIMFHSRIVERLPLVVRAVHPSSKVTGQLAHLRGRARTVATLVHIVYHSKPVANMTRDGQGFLPIRRKLTGTFTDPRGWLWA